MNKNRHAVVQSIVISRRNLIQLIVVAILLAFGLNLIAGYVLDSAIVSPLVTIVVGTVVCVGSVLYLAARVYARRVESHTYEAFFIYDKKKNETIPVPRYRFSETLYDYLQCAFTENPALKTLWEKEPLKNLFVEDKKKGREERHKSAQLVSEAAEYYVLDRLSIHLTDYFNVEAVRQEKLKEYGRDDVPEVLLTNRFLELFSRPMEDRPAFVNGTFGEKGNGETVAVYLPGQAIYEKFDLVLPKESIVRRPEDNKVEIGTEKLKMSITVRFQGFRAVLPRGFEEYYMGANDWQNITPYTLDIDIKVLMKFRALLSRAGWEYYRWVDSFLEVLEEELSEDAFFKRIHWESAFTVLQCVGRAQQKKAKKNKVG